MMNEIRDPDFVIDIIGASLSRDDEEEREEAGLIVKIKQFFTKPDGERSYRTILNHALSTFLLSKPIKVGTTQLYELIEKVTIQTSNPEESQFPTEPVNTELSRGFCISLPELGDFIISHDGNIIINGNENMKDKTVEIISPNQVVLQNVPQSNLIIEATAVLVLDESNIQLNSLTVSHSNYSPYEYAFLILNPNASLIVEKLFLDKTIVHNIGELYVDSIISNSGTIINSCNVFCDRIDNLTYYYGSNDSTLVGYGNLSILSKYLTNNGKISGENVSLTVSQVIHNHGEIISQKDMKITSIAQTLNEGTLESSNGKITFCGDTFSSTNNSSIRAKITKFLTNFTILNGNLRTNTSIFNNNVQLYSELTVQHAEVRGILFNFSIFIANGTISFLGEKTVLINSGIVHAQKIISEAEECLISDRIEKLENIPQMEKITNENCFISCCELNVRSTLQIEAKFDEIDQISVFKDGKLNITEDSSINHLKSLFNHGKSVLMKASPDLKYIMNSPDAYLYLDSNTTYENIEDISEILGESVIGDRFPKIIDLYLNRSTTMTLLHGDEFINIKSIFILKKSSLMMSLTKYTQLENIQTDGVLILTKDSDGNYKGDPKIVHDFPKLYYLGSVDSTLELQDDVIFHIGEINNCGTIRSDNNIHIYVPKELINRYGTKAFAKRFTFHFSCCIIFTEDSNIPDFLGCNEVVFDIKDIFFKGFGISTHLIINAERVQIQEKSINYFYSLDIRAKSILILGHLNILEHFNCNCDIFKSYKGTIQTFQTIKIKCNEFINECEGMRLPLDYEYLIVRPEKEIPFLVPQFYASLMSLGGVEVECNRATNLYATIYGKNFAMINSKEKLVNFAGFIISEGFIDIKTGNLFNAKLEYQFKFDQFPYYTRGTISSLGQISIQMKELDGVGSIVSNQDVIINGRKLLSEGSIVANNIVRLDITRVSFNELNIKAKNIDIETRFSAILKGRFAEKKEITPNGYYVDITGMAMNMSFMLFDEHIFGPDYIHKRYIPKKNEISDCSFTVKYPSTSAIKGTEKNQKEFISYIPDLLMAKVIELVLRPFYGFNNNPKKQYDILLKLEKNGIWLKNHPDPETLDIALFYSDKYTEINILDKTTNNTRTIQRRQPILMIPYALEQKGNFIKAVQSLRIASGCNITIHHDHNISAKNLTLEAGSNIIIEPSVSKIESHSMFHHYQKDSVTPVIIDIPGDLVVIGKKGIDNKAGQLVANNIVLRTDGDINDHCVAEKEFKKQWMFFCPSRTMETEKLICSQYHAKCEIFKIAKHGSINEKATQLSAGKRITYDTINHRCQAEFVHIYNADKWSKIHVDDPHGSLIQAPEIVLHTFKTSSLGTQMIFDNLEVHGDIEFKGAIGKKITEKIKVKRKRFLGASVGKTKITINSDEEIFLPSVILGKEINCIGKGNFLLEGAIGDILKLNIGKKNLIDKVYLKHSKSTVKIHSSGIITPKIKADPLIDAWKELQNTHSIQDGVPSLLNLASVSVQTASQFVQLANLSKLSDPTQFILQTFCGRYISSFGYHNILTTINTEQTTAVQSHMKVGVLFVDNDFTHLEGIWDVDSAEIYTKEFSMKASQNITQTHVKSKGFSVMFSPLNFLKYGGIVPGLSAMCLLPIVNGFYNGSKSYLSQNVPAKFNANRLLLQCNNALILGSQVKAKIVSMLVSGNLTVETFTDLFKEHALSASITLNCSKIMDEVKNTSPDVRIGREDKINKYIDNIASLVGTEEFYFKVGCDLIKRNAFVGLTPAGRICKEGEEEIVAKQIIEENVEEIKYKNQHVFRTNANELIGFMDSINEFNEIRAKLSEAEQCEKESQQNKQDELEKLKRNIEKFKEIKEKLSNACKTFRKRMKNIATETKSLTASKETIVKKDQAFTQIKQEVDTISSELNRIIEEYNAFSSVIPQNQKSYFDETINVFKQIGNKIVEFCRVYNDVRDKGEAYIQNAELFNDDEEVEFRYQFKQELVDLPLDEEYNFFVEVSRAMIDIAGISAYAGSISKFSRLSRALSRQITSKNINKRLLRTLHSQFEEAGLLTRTGQLTQEAIDSSTQIIKFSKLKNEALKNEMNLINDNQMWCKYKTKSVELYNGQKARIHYYKNSETGELFLNRDFKIKLGDDSIPLK
ncbi:hypothetical protein TVAGG3_0339860 [Trichomonas vaginalis G3]|uniref:hypothetical protein n=1 Tax=Trichomonas vaginalis (strain ATCC PRA-98 / G3) TaxID=412133 RepID=UPI0021E5D3CD|nr:hypothetical protein TVAGG3_0339860 [Trichomonas vaginalis G3]KAI5530560.1 hypothetical protein TVAGG3_0339860 [Trichomonas vaginalis G3]